VFTIPAPLLLIELSNYSLRRIGPSLFPIESNSFHFLLYIHRENTKISPVIVNCCSLQNIICHHGGILVFLSNVEKNGSERTALFFQFGFEQLYPLTHSGPDWTFTGLKSDFFLSLCFKVKLYQMSF